MFEIMIEEIDIVLLQRVNDYIKSEKHYLTNSYEKLKHFDVYLKLEVVLGGKIEDMYMLVLMVIGKELL
jgi:hypothetical protein